MNLDLFEKDAPKQELYFASGNDRFLSCFFENNCGS